MMNEKNSKNCEIHNSQFTTHHLPRLRFPEFRDAGPWEVKRLGEIADSLTSLSGKTSKDFGHGNAFYVPYVNVYENAFVDPNKLERVDVAPNENQNKIQRGDLLFTVSSETPDEAGMSSVVVHDISNCYVNSFCAIYRPVSSIQLDLTFAGYYLRSPIVRKHFLKTAQGAIRFNLNREAFQKTPVLLPTPLEQQKIADCLSSLDDLIRAEASQLEALQAHKKGLMQELFPREGETTPRLRFPEFRDAGPWEVKRLGKLVRTVTPPAKLQTSEYLPSGQFPIIDQSPSDICGWSNDETAVVQGDFPFVVFGDHTCTVKLAVGPFAQGADGIKILAPTPEIDARFLFLALQADPIEQKGYKRHFSTLKEKLIPFPQKDTGEQQKIADCLSSLDDLIRAQGERIETLKQHKKGLMQQLFPQEVG